MIWRKCCGMQGMLEMLEQHDPVTKDSEILGCRTVTSPDYHAGQCRQTIVSDRWQWTAMKNVGCPATLPICSTLAPRMSRPRQRTHWNVGE
jgi:hypothetical protein